MLDSLAQPTVHRKLFMNAKPPSGAPAGDAPASGTGTRFRAGLANAFLLGCTLMLLAAAGEWTIRQLHLLEATEAVDAEGRSLYVPDADLGYVMRPNTVARLQRPEFSVALRTNAHGYRDDPFSHPPEGAVIVGLGDSFAWGHGVEEEESFFSVAEAQQRRADPALRIHNLAVTGYSQVQHRRQIARARELGAHMVILAACLTNDVLENGGIIQRKVTAREKRRDAYENRDTGASDPAAEPSWLAANSHLYAFILARLNRLDHRLDLGSSDWYSLDQLKHTPDPRTAAAYDATRRYLDEILRQCNEAAIRLVVMTVPQTHMVSPAVFARVLDHYGKTADAYDARRVANFYADWCSENGVAHLDGTKELARGETAPESYFYPRDRHLNRMGHHALGHALAAFLADMTD